MKRYTKRRNKKIVSVIFGILFIFIVSMLLVYQDEVNDFFITKLDRAYDMADIPTYQNKPYVILNHNEPNFTEEDIQSVEKEVYSDLDRLGRCGVAFAKVGLDTMPTEKRGSIGMIKPSGWHTVKYDIVNGKYLYNRCHLIGYQLTGENANPKNLITCTRYMNTVGMLEFENKVANYVKETKNHVLYRVTPVFENNNLVASGVTIEAKSVEDDGAGIRFHVYVYNVQDGIEINYANGESHLAKKDISY